LVLIGRNYLETRDPELSTEQAALLIERHAFDDRAAGAELLGADMAEFGSPDVRRAVDRLLEREADSDGRLAMARLVDPYEPRNGLKFVRALRAGFETGLAA
jgi:predicted nucleotidyltransferase